MKFLWALTLLVGLGAASPTVHNDKLIIDSGFYLENFVIYTSNYDIVNIVTPLNDINFADHEDTESKTTDDDSDLLLNVKFFFVEAEINDKGNKEYKGLYIFQNGKATKLLDNGVDIAVPKGKNKLSYFGAKDGIYKYNQENNKLEKYGVVTDSIINIVHRNISNDLVILTKDHSLYVVTEEGTKTDLVEDVKDVEQIIVDWSDNVYYYGPDKQPYMANADGIVKIEGLPENPSYVRLIRPPFVLADAVVFLSDESIYFLFANGTSTPIDFEVKSSSRPTAESLEAALVTYYGHEKKIYGYNILLLALTDVVDELKQYLKDKKNSVQEIATRYKQL